MEEPGTTSRPPPPWTAIEAFIAAAEAISFKQAAADLGLSPSALSRRIQKLEHRFGACLFERGAGATALTAAGARYLRLLRPGFDALRNATERMAPDADRRPLRLRVSHSLGATWLTPRLARFCAAHPAIDLLLDSAGSAEDLAGGSADLGIFYGGGPWPNLVATELFAPGAFIVSAPRLADGRLPPRTSDEIVGYELLDLSDPGAVWPDWLKRAGYGGSADPDRLR